METGTTGSMTRMWLSRFTMDRSSTSGSAMGCCECRSTSSRTS